MTEEKIKEVLSGIMEPVSNSDFVSAGLIRNISLNGKKLILELATPETDSNVLVTLGVNIKNTFKEKIPEISEVAVNFTAGVTEHINSKKSSVLPGVKNTIAIASGKGGVGKSTVAVNLAVALAKMGYRVGLIDADIYGPSIPLMFGIKDKPGVTQIDGKNKLVPLEKYGVKIMSIGFLMEENTAVVWRGPMASSALKQFMGDVVWGDLDFLLFDMPPGTGDIQLTLSQTIPLTGAVIVTTPQEISLADARKGYIMFEKVSVPTIGIVENMSYYEDQGGKREYIFGKGGGMKMCNEFGIELLGEVPVNSDIRKSGDEGIPLPAEKTTPEAGKIFEEIAGKLAKAVTKFNASRVTEPDTVIEF
ncbi:MAG: P-loop NTPase [Ignavibacteria bacterium]|jgi:ATP-binding protein involved in chromosome partitioning|nr:P-loop NTPase [Ignavibacteria bacterium]MBK6878885.1 P-loop NTPase [Ignavibacteria bacterium]